MKILYPNFYNLTVCKTWVTHLQKQEPSMVLTILGCTPSPKAWIRPWELTVVCIRDGKQGRIESAADGTLVVTTQVTVIVTRPSPMVTGGWSYVDAGPGRNYVSDTQSSDVVILHLTGLELKKTTSITQTNVYMKHIS